jgi:hypothetical protein
VSPLLTITIQDSVTVIELTMMVNEMKKIVLALLFVLFGSSAFASNQNPIIAVYHFKDGSCGAWAKTASTPSTRQVYVHWIRGFVSGYNFGAPNDQVTNMLSDETVALYVDKFCRENPLSLFTASAFKLVDELKTK